MMCHYCGYTMEQPKVCPSCGSRYIAPFGTGTQKIETMAAERFPDARILRMDLDTTSKKGGHQEILSAFARGEADILIGTQMIVKGHDFPKVTLVGALVITTIAVGDVNSLLAQGKQAISNMEALGDVLLPTVSMATAARGEPAMAAVKHSITILFSDLLLHLIQNLLIPLCYAYVAANVAWAALGNDGLKRIGGLLKWLITILLSVVLLTFIAYLNLSGVISGGADAATVKAAKFTISNLVPVVGGVISDTAETLLAGASVLRNAAGVFGMLAVLGICVVPFLNLGVHYLMYKCTAALAATASGNGRITGLIEALGTAFGLILAMTAACAVLLVVAMVSAVSAVTG